jgi:hypothetical protein
MSHFITLNPIIKVSTSCALCFFLIFLCYISVGTTPLSTSQTATGDALYAAPIMACSCLVIHVPQISTCLHCVLLCAGSKEKR